MPPKRSSHRPPLPTRVSAAPNNTTTTASNRVCTGGGTTFAADATTTSVVSRRTEARVQKIDQDIRDSHRLIDKYLEQERRRYKFLCGVLCEFVPGYYTESRQNILMTLCDTHVSSIGTPLLQGKAALEKRRNQLTAILMNGNAAPAHVEAFLTCVEEQAKEVVEKYRKTLVASEAFATYNDDVREELESSRSSLYPALTPEQRANATSHTNPKTLPVSYFEHILASIEEPHLAEHHLENAIKEAPGCHIAWRILALILIEKPLVKTQPEERIAERLAPLGHYAKVVQLLPKDVHAWWSIAKLLFAMEEDFMGEEKLRSLIFITVNDKKYSSWDCFVRVVELEPNVPVYWMHLGKSMLRSHHPFALEERLVTIAFEGGPTMTEVSARYCYEAYLRLYTNVATQCVPWRDVARVMLDERDVTVDVDDEFTSIEFGGRALTRPQVLAKMVSAEPNDPQTWRMLFRTLTTEPDSYRVPLTGMAIPGFTKESVSAQDCLAHVMETLPICDPYTWIMMYDILERRDTIRDQLHKACPQSEDNVSTTKMPHTCLISGKHYTKLDCALMVHQLTVVLKGDAPTKSDSVYSYGASCYCMWIIMASLAGESPTYTLTLPKGVLTLPLTTPLNSFNPQNRHISMCDLLKNILHADVRRTCWDQARLLILLRQWNDVVSNGWRQFISTLYYYLTESYTCKCVPCSMLTGAVIQRFFSEEYNGGTYLEYLSRSINTSSLDPERWEDLGWVLQPQHKVTLSANDESSREYTRVDCFRQAIESPKRWNRAGSWLALGNALNKGEVLDVHGKPHTREDCFKQARLWFDEEPIDLKQLTRAPRIAHRINSLVDGDNENDESTDSDDEEVNTTVSTDATPPEIECAVADITNAFEMTAEGKMPEEKINTPLSDALSPTQYDDPVTALEAFSGEDESTANANVKDAAEELVGIIPKDEYPLLQSDMDAFKPFYGGSDDEETSTASTSTPTTPVETIPYSEQQPTAPISDMGEDTPLKAQNTIVMEASCVRRTRAVLTAFQCGLTALKIFSEGGGIFKQ